MNKHFITIALIAVGIYLYSANGVLSFKHQASLTEVEQAYLDFKQEFYKSYTTEEDEYRFVVFTQNYDLIKRINAEDRPYKLGVTKFSDLTLEEFKALYLGRKNVAFDNSSIQYELMNENDIPASVDWVKAGGVVKVKDQGQCGSCWAFSTVGSCENAFWLKQGKSGLTSLSEQQIVDCSTKNAGCNGGDLPPAFAYVVKDGMEPESAYKYQAVDQKCKYDKSKVVFTPTGYKMVTPNNSQQMAAALVNQVLSVCIEADSAVFQNYRSGILDSSACGTELDHCVTLTGYNSNPDYWVIKNSWGASWGNKGFAWIARTSASGRGICGIAEEPGYPTY